jgi:hypothetical protein
MSFAFVSVIFFNTGMEILFLHSILHLWGPSHRKALRCSLVGLYVIAALSLYYSTRYDLSS